MVLYLQLASLLSLAQLSIAVDRAWVYELPSAIARGPRPIEIMFFLLLMFSF